MQRERKPGDMKRRRHAAYQRGRCELAEELLALLHQGKPKAVLAQLRAEIRRERGQETSHEHRA
jgi:hypothetical protein